MKILIKDVLLNNQFQSILIEDNLIKKIAKKIDTKVDDVIDGKCEKAVIPGLINSHTHSSMNLLRGLADDLPLIDWLQNKIWPIEAKMTDEDVYWGTKMAMLEMIMTGTTTFNEMYLFREAQIKAISEMGMRAFVGMVLFDDSTGSLPKDTEEMFEKYHHTLPETIRLSVAPHAIYTVETETLIWAKEFAKKNNLLIHMHLSETKHEVDDCIEKYKMRPVEYLNKINLLGKNCLFAHSIWLNENEIILLSKNKCNLIYNPTSNMKLASGAFQFEKIKNNGINITLGTDGAASNNSLDLFSEMKIGALLPKLLMLDPTHAKAEDIFDCVSKNAAQALQINSGEIKAGKLADITLLDLNNTGLQPNHNLISNIVYSANGSCVTDVLINGKIIMRNRKIKDYEKIHRKFKEISSSIIKR
jgi:5-methylthioadenosine/S-adenosylhomocysteine deaminase